MEDVTLWRKTLRRWGRPVMQLPFSLVGRRLREERFLLLLICLFFPIWGWTAAAPREMVSLVDWHTIAALAGLILLSRALEGSGALALGAAFALSRLRTERSLTVGLVMISAALAAVVTNDVALFIVIPLTLAMGQFTRLPLCRLFIFQALAVNAGSALSPIGNPQNLYLWQVSEVGFLEFVWHMLPLALPFSFVLGVAILIGFRRRDVTVDSTPLPDSSFHRRLFWPALFGYPVFLLALEFGRPLMGLALVAAALAVVHPRLLLRLDLCLLLIFILMFINLGLLAQLPALAALAAEPAATPTGTYLVGALLSQVISNVPATIFLAPLTNDWRALAWGCNVGGFGLAIGSLANLIALRLARQPGMLREFHLWSIPIFVVCLLASLLLL